MVKLKTQGIWNYSSIEEVTQAEAHVPYVVHCSKVTGTIQFYDIKLNKTQI